MAAVALPYLGEQQIAESRRDGYLAVPELIDRQRVKELRGVTEEFTFLRRARRHPGAGTRSACGPAGAPPTPHGPRPLPILSGGGHPMSGPMHPAPPKGGLASGRTAGTPPSPGRIPSGPEPGALAGQAGGCPVASAPRPSRSAAKSRRGTCQGRLDARAHDQGTPGSEATAPTPRDRGE